MIIVITGPTCMGKSETALEVAKAFNCEIINGDAFQSYKQLNIGVAKPPFEYFDIIPHHLFSFVDVEHEYSIAEYQINLRKTIDDIVSRGKNVVIVGGSGLYIKSALYDFDFSEDKKVDLSKYVLLDNDALHKELEKIDPEQAAIIHKNNRKRVLRALEIFLSQGKTKSEIINVQEHKAIYDVKFFVRSMDRTELYLRINNRVDEMIKNGLIDEVKSLISKYDKNLKSFQAIGYKEIISCLEKNGDLTEAIEEIKKNTRNYAKRQMTYIRHQFPVEYYKNTADLIGILKKC